MDDSIIEFEHSILNGWIANNFHSYINNNEISHDNSISILDGQVQDLTNREYQLVNELNHCKQMLDTERTDRIILLKLLEDKDNLIRQLQTQLSQQPTDTHQSIPVEQKPHSNEPLDGAYLSDDFNKVENEIKILLSQNKKLKYKANKSIKHRIRDEQHQHTPSHSTNDEDYLALRQMIDIQEEIESRLTSEVSGLKGTVQQQNTLLKEWERREANITSKGSEKSRDEISYHYHSSSSRRREEKEEEYEQQQQHEESVSKDKHSSNANNTRNNDHNHSPTNHSEGSLSSVGQQHLENSHHTEQDRRRQSPQSQSQSQSQSRYITTVSPFPSFSPTTSSTTSLYPHTRSPAVTNFSPSKIRHDLDRLLDEIHSVTSFTSTNTNTTSNTSKRSDNVEVLSENGRSECGERGRSSGRYHK